MLNKAISLGIYLEASRLKSSLTSGLISGLGSGIGTAIVNKDNPDAIPHAIKWGTGVGAGVTALSAATYDKGREEALEKYEKDRSKKKTA